MGKAELAALKRLGRGIVSLGISVGVGYLTKNPFFVALTPVLNMLAKWLRDKYHLQNIPL